MSTPDILQTSAKAYRITWAERAYLAKMAIIPLLVKYIFLSIVLNYTGTENLLRFAIIMLPAYLVEGWYLAHWARTIILDHRWPFQPSGNPVKDDMIMKERGKGVIGGLVSFTLINFLMAGFFSLFLRFIPTDMTPDNADPSLALLGFFMLGISFVLFRYIWLYIPLSLNISLPYAMQKLKPLGLTFPLMGIWLLCFAPAMFILQSLLSLLIMMVGENPLPAFQGLMTFIKVVFDLVVNLLCTGALTLALIQIFGYQSKS